MKQLLAILIIVTITNPAFSQANSSLLFKGKWISEAFEDPIRISFLDEQNGIINWETWSKTESRFIYKTTIR
ncbi:MAG TPA: hypothetical protein VFE04_10970, partial [Puia sp.]|nr:hypothetical protein [Puia sp.]